MGNRVRDVPGGDDAHATTSPAVVGAHDTRHTTGTGGEPLGQVARASLPPILAARYELKRVIGVGGMGLVYEALDLNLHRLVALKVLKLAPTKPEERAEAVNRLVREARAMAAVSHKNVVTVHDVSSHEDQVFVAMQLVEGATLRQWLQSSKRKTAEILNLMFEAGSGLAAAHHVRLIHRDFKPDNVLVSQRGTVRVTDFGLARRADGMIEPTGITSDRVSAPGAIMDGDNIDVTSVTRSGAIVGTPAYMAPEQAAGHPCDARADQFSFCVTAWEALYGARPFAGKNWSEIYTSVQSQTFALPPADRSVPRSLNRALRRGLSVDPNARFASMDELLEVFQDAMRAPVRRRSIAFGALAVTAVIAAVIISRNVGGEDARPAATVDTSSNFVREEPAPRPPIEMPVRERVQHATRLKGKVEEAPPKKRVEAPRAEPPPAADPRLEALHASYAALDDDLRRRELLESDVPAFGEAKRAMKSALDAKDADRAAAELARAHQLTAISIDRDFINKKMQRIGKVPPEKQAEITARVNEVLTLTDAGNFAAANRKLNEIVKLIK
jgi:serine/threonine protein kinase